MRDRKFSILPKVDSPDIFLAVPMAKNAIMQAQTAAFCSGLSKNENVNWGFVNAMSPEFSRNSLIEHHLANNDKWTHIFFIDSDVVPPNDALVKLLQLDADIATGFYPIFANHLPLWCIEGPGSTNFISLFEELPKEPFATTACGGGCLLIRREVLTEIGWPWFKTEYQKIFENGKCGIKIGEDVFFCKKAIESGFEVIAHPGVICSHYNSINMLEYFNTVISMAKKLEG